MDGRLTQTLSQIRSRQVTGPRPEILRFRIIENGGTEEYEIKGPRVVVGAHPNADLTLDDEQVSALHCEFEVRPDGAAILRDLGSKNGTWVADGSVKVVEVLLRPGARVQIGEAIVELLGARDAEVPVSTTDRFGDLYGVGGKMGALIASLELQAPTEISVLVVGESGTGKELVAKGLHDQSFRSAGPFQVLDCGSLTLDLAASEIFGHAKGAFTGAAVSKPGVFEVAHGGTIFLDEIGELPIDVQPMLLRALESRTSCRVGENDFRSFDVRVVAATNRDLRKAVNDGKFREDLYFRLAQSVVRVPPLRERDEGNVALLADLFLARVRSSMGKGTARFSRDAVQAMEGAHWQGNVRELRNVVARVAQLAVGPQIDTAELELEEGGPRSVSASMSWAEVSWEEAKREFERFYVAQVLAKTRSRAEANRLMGVSASTFHAILKRTGER